MKTSCPHCGQHYELDDSFAGQPVTCERCRKDFTVPAAVPLPSETRDSGASDETLTETNAALEVDDADQGNDRHELIDEIVRRCLRPEDDETVRQAIEVVLLEGKASTSHIQRRLKLGYNRSAEIMDLMEERGIIGPPSGDGKPREIRWQYLRDLPPETRRRCPYCAGEIPAGVKKCCHCGEWIEKNRKIRIIALAAAMVVLLGVAAAVVFFVAIPRVVPAEPRPASDASVPKKPKIVHPTICVKNFATPAPSATCVLYKNSREIMRRDTTIGWVMFERVECSPEDFFRVEMQYRNSYGVIEKISCSYGRTAASKSEGNVLVLEPEKKNERVYSEKEVIPKGLMVLRSLDALRLIRKERGLTDEEKQEAKELFAYLIDVHTVKNDDEEGRRLLKAQRKAWGLE